MNLNAECILNQSVRIASLPAIFNRINEAVKDPECSFLELSKIISSDQGLSVRILKVANSSFFGFPSQIETITHAVAIIGMTQIRDLVLATKVTEHFKGVPRRLIDMKSFWMHSIACGLASRILATYRHESNVERYYVLGMFHDLGRLIFYLNISDQIKKVMACAKSENELLYKMEREMIGCDHAEVGGVLLKRWQIPESLVEPVFYHHNPSSSLRYPLEAAILHVADLIAHALNVGFSGDSMIPSLDNASWERIDLPSSLLPAIVNQIDRQLFDALKLFCPED